MGKVPVKFREVVYTLSPFEQHIMGSLWKDIPEKAGHYVTKVRRVQVWGHWHRCSICAARWTAAVSDGVGAGALAAVAQCSSPPPLQVRDAVLFAGLPLFGIGW